MSKGKVKIGDFGFAKKNCNKRIRNQTLVRVSVFLSQAQAEFDRINDDFANMQGHRNLLTSTADGQNSFSSDQVGRLMEIAAGLELQLTDLGKIYDRAKKEAEDLQNRVEPRLPRASDGGC